MLWDRYVLDLDRGCLLLEGSEIALRPKTFAVLVYLVENHARLVSKGEIFAAVWPNITVTDTRWCKASANCGVPWEMTDRAWFAPCRAAVIGSMVPCRP